MVRFNHDFHTAIAEISGNPFLASWMSGLLDQGQRMLRLYARNQGDKVPDSVLKPHRDMVEAIAAGDADKAEAAGRADAAGADGRVQAQPLQPAGGCCC